MPRWSLALLLAACGSSPGAPDAPGADATPPPDARIIGALEQVVDSGPGFTDATTYPDGGPLTVPWRIIDDCRVCMVADGMRCGRRASCPTEACVLTDGTLVEDGAAIETAWCHTCTCTDGVLRCTPRSDDACPADRCIAEVWGMALDLAAGEERFVSECHVVVCDPARGLTFADICHDGCSTETGAFVDLYTAALHPDGCSICTCVYGSWCCDGTETCVEGGDAYCPLPGDACLDLNGASVPSGAYGTSPGGATCRCVGTAWQC